MKKFVLTLLGLLLVIHQLHGATRRVLVDSVKIKSEVLLVDFTIDGIIDQKTAEGLQKGLTSTIEYQVQLWEKRSGWFNSLIAEQDVRMKVLFDNWEKKYVILSAEESRLTSSLETVREKCSQMQNIDIVPISKLKKNKKYFITVKAILRPFSVENYQEIKNWLSGQAKNLDLEKLDDTEKQEKRFKGGLLKMFLALTGFGDRVITGKSSDFKIEQNNIIWIK